MNREDFLRLKMGIGVPLSEDVLIEILIYLSVKSLIRFRCVSKYWCTLMKCPTFVSRHFKCDRKEIILLKRYLPPPNSEQIYQGGDDILSFHESSSPNILVSSNILIPFLEDISGHQYISLFGPCNGLICLVYPDIVIFSNPALREFELLPSCPFPLPEGYADILSVAGFGFDANTNAYKVVHLWKIVEKMADYPNEDTFIRIDLYNSRTHSWKAIDAMVPGIRYHPGFDLYFNGSHHWQANDFIDGPPSMGIILSFDVSTEVFNQFEFPECFDDAKVPSLVVLNQCLGLVRYGGWMIDEPNLIDVWLMKEYGIKESWTKELIIGPYLLRCPLLSWKNEWLFVEASDGQSESCNSQLASCALHAQEIRKFEFHGLEGTFRALPFTESLVSLNQVLRFKKD